MSTKCDLCGKATTIKKGQTYHYIESGLDNVYLENIEVRVCKSCNAICPRIPKINQLHDTIARATTLQPYPLSGKDIRFLRQHMGLKAREWAALLRIDVTTLSRWESGEQKIGPQSDSLIRLLYIRLMEERQGQIFQESATEKIASVKKVRPRFTKLSVNMNNPSVYSYQS
ncbi:MAG: type II toxin-antitoxin system MqsA family antitoxin [Blastocatellia bacterium]|nr:type II toxin-antitoxin system MqsA family antitoxin [Blastocatellia bacterium]